MNSELVPKIFQNIIGGYGLSDKKIKSTNKEVVIKHEAIKPGYPMLCAFLSTNSRILVFCKIWHSLLQ